MSEVYIKVLVNNNVLIEMQVTNKSCVLISRNYFDYF